MNFLSKQPCLPLPPPPHPGIAPAPRSRKRLTTWTLWRTPGTTEERASRPPKRRTEAPGTPWPGILSARLSLLSTTNWQVRFNSSDPWGGWVEKQFQTPAKKIIFRPGQIRQQANRPPTLFPLPFRPEENHQRPTKWKKITTKKLYCLFRQTPSTPTAVHTVLPINERRIPSEIGKDYPLPIKEILCNNWGHPIKISFTQNVFLCCERCSCCKKIRYERCSCCFWICLLIFKRPTPLPKLILFSWCCVLCSCCKT